MKTFKNYWFFLGLMMTMLCFTACSEDDEEVIPVFPTETESITGAAGESKTLSFTANMQWNLSSDKTWCLLGTEQKQNISGNAGEQNVTITINNDGLTFSEESAKIILTMGTESKTIATVTRDAKEYEFQIKDAEGNVVETLEISASATATYFAEANFEFAAVYDETLMTITKGEAEEGTYNYEISIEIKETKNPINKEVTFQNEAGSAVYTYSIEYAGMDPMDIIFNPGSAWGTYVTTDGAKYYNLLNTDNVNDAPYKATITALNDEYTLVYYRYDSEWGMTQYQSHEKPWFTVSDDTKGNLSVSFEENTGAERKGYIFAFSNAFYETIKDDMDKFIVEDTNASVWEIATKAENYLVAEFIQEANEDVTATGFTVKLQGYLDVETTKVTDPDILAFVAGECMYSGSEVYSISVEPGSFLQIFPNLPEDQWNCEMYPMFIGINDEVLGYEPGIWDDGKHYFSITVPETSEPFFISIHSNWTAFHKVLIIYPLI